MTQPERANDLWGNFRDTLRAGVSETNWDTWLSRLEPDIDGDRIILVAPSEFHLRWVQDKHGDLIDGVYDAAQMQVAQDEARYEAMSEKQIAREIKALEKKMLEHARNLEFEEAAKVRDRLTELKRKVFGVAVAPE